MRKFALLCLPAIWCLHLELSNHEEGQTKKELFGLHGEGVRDFHYEITSSGFPQGQCKHHRRKEGSWVSPEPASVSSGGGIFLRDNQGDELIQQVVLQRKVDSLESISNQVQEVGQAWSIRQRQRRYVGDGYVSLGGSEMPQNTTTTLVHCEQLIILRKTNLMGELISCTFSDRQVKEDEQYRQVSKWKNFADSIFMDESIGNFMDLVEECLKLKEPEVLKQWTFGTLYNFIAPGTLWCGLNNKANHLTQLGLRSTVDHCCRMHDLCPVQLIPLRSYKQIFNLSPKTMSHCECDGRFSKCLREEKSSGARGIFHLYFNTLYTRKLCVSQRYLSENRPVYYSTVIEFMRYMSGFFS